MSLGKSVHFQLQFVPFQLRNGLYFREGMLIADRMRQHSDNKLIKFHIILVINQANAQILFYNKFIICLYMFRALCAHHQEVKTVLYSIWYHHTETSEWYQSIHWHEQNAVIPCRSQEPPPFLPIIHFFLPLLSANHSSILPHFIQLSISWSASWSYCFQIHVQYSFGNPIFFHSLYMSKPT